MSGVPGLIFTSYFDGVLGSLPVKTWSGWEEERQLNHCIGEKLLEVLLFFGG